jgi:hypothetical protein
MCAAVVSITLLAKAADLCAAAAAAAAAQVVSTTPAWLGSCLAGPWLPAALLQMAYGPPAALTTPAGVMDMRETAHVSIKTGSSDSPKTGSFRPFTPNYLHNSALNQAVSTRIKSTRPGHCCPTTHQAAIIVHLKGASGDELVADHVAHKPHTHTRTKAIGGDVGLIPAGSIYRAEWWWWAYCSPLK